ncbi:hypothetical protein ACFSHP_03585 [Novosphingobium panipatense]
MIPFRGTASYALNGDKAQMRQNGEPSVEEILQSIKQVIARDSRLDTRTSRTERLTRDAEALFEGEDLEEDDVLELPETAQLLVA